MNLSARRVRKLRPIAEDLRRLRTAYRGIATPNPRELRLVRVPWRQRMMEWWQVWLAEWKASAMPRTPEQVAMEAYKERLLGVT